MGWNETEKQFTIDFLLDNGVIGSEYGIKVVAQDAAEIAKEIAVAKITYADNQRGAAFSTGNTNRLYKGIPMIGEAEGTPTVPVSIYSLVMEAVKTTGFKNGTQINTAQLEQVNKILKDGGIWIENGRLTDEVQGIMTLEGNTIPLQTRLLLPGSGLQTALPTGTVQPALLQTTASPSYWAALLRARPYSLKL